jgi:alpha-L-fucosidase
MRTLSRLLSGSTLAVAFLLAPLMPSAETEPPAYPNLSAEDRARIAWWLDARYGMFIHWGVASIKGVELSWARGGSKPLDIFKDPAGYVEDPVYDRLYKTWNPAQFDAREWVRIAKAGGMRYMVLTAKHHDGFCLWDSKLTDYTIMHTPFKRDVVKELTEACRAEGMRVGLYYSQRDWHHPQYGVGDNQAYRTFMNGQLTELLSNYGTIDIIWFDSYGRGDLKTFWGIDETWKLIKRLQPQAVVNNRLAILAGYNQQGPDYWGDFDTPEQTIGKMQTHRPWESCMCFVGHQWGFKPDGEMYSLDKLIRAIVSCATGDGNLLMNVGPMPTGAIEPRQAERLKEAGDWLTRFGTTVRGTRGGPWENAPWGGATRRGNQVFLHVFHWRGTETLRLLPLHRRITSARVLTGGEVTVDQSPTGIDVTVAKAHHDAIDTIIELTLDGPADMLVKGASLRSLFEGDAYGGIISASAGVSASSSGKGDHPARHPELVAVPAIAKGPVVTTAVEANPFVTIDLGTVRTIKGVRIEPANGRDGKLNTLVAAWSVDGSTWTEAWRCPEPDAALEFPVSTLTAGAQVPGCRARYVRLMLEHPKWALSLRRVVVYGE